MRQTANYSNSINNGTKPFRMKVKTPTNEVQTLRFAKLIRKGKPLIVNLEKLDEETRDATEMHYKGLAMFHNASVMQFTKDIIGFIPKDMVNPELRREEEIKEVKEKAKRTAQEWFEKELSENEEVFFRASEIEEDSVSACIDDIRSLLGKSKMLPFSELVPIDPIKLESILDRLEALA